MKHIGLVLLFLGVAAADRLTKIAIINGWEYRFGFLRLERFDNHGLVFSIPIAPLLAILISSLVIVLIVFWMLSHRSRLHQLTLIGASFILLGAMSNLLDRMLYRVVLDWISFGSWFTIFNLADVSIGIGVGLWLYDLTKQKVIA